MSDASILLVPKDPSFQPKASKATEAEAVLRTFLPDAEAISASYFDSVTFIDAGQNWSGVVCPLCQTGLDQWWSTAMSDAYETRFENLVADLPCCPNAVSLNDLNYPWPVAFGSWQLEARNPNRPGLEPEEMDALAKLLGTPLTQVIART